MNREDLFNAIDSVDEKLVSEATAEKNVKKFKIPKVAMAAAALAVCVGCSAAAYAATGHFADIKNLFGTVTGTEYVDATDDLDIKFLGFKDGQMNVGFDIKNPDKAPYMTLNNGAELNLLSYNVTDDDGNVILDSGDSVIIRHADGTPGNVTEYSYTETEGEVMPYVWTEDGETELNGEFSDSAITYSIIIGSTNVTCGEFGLTFDEQLEKFGLEKGNLVECDDISSYSFTYVSADENNNQVEIMFENGYKDVTTGKVYLFPTGSKPLDKGKYTINVDKLVMTSKGDQPLEISGNWQTSFDIGDDNSGLFL